MAFRRNLAVRAKQYTQQQLTPSFIYLRNENDDRSKVEDPKMPKFSPRSFAGTRSDSLLGFGRSSPISSLNGAVFARHMSSSIVDCPKVLELVSENVSGVSEVAAAADSLFPVAGLQYLMAGVHDFTALHWWPGIAATSVLIGWIATPQMVNRLRKEVKEMLQIGHAAADLREKHMPYTLRENHAFLSDFDTLFGSKLIRGSVFLGSYFAIDNMVSLTSGGALSFTDLTTIDSSITLPMLVALAYLIRIENNMPEKPSYVMCSSTITSVSYRRCLPAFSVALLLFCIMPKVSDKRNRNVRDHKKRLLASKYELRRKLYKAFCKDPNLPTEIREKQRYKLSKLPRNSSFGRVKNRCIFSGRPRSVYEMFRMSRIVFRDLASRGLLNGIKKSSW